MTLLVMGYRGEPVRLLDSGYRAVLARNLLRIACRVLCKIAVNDSVDNPCILLSVDLSGL